jgi:hypothetical protein
MDNNQDALVFGRSKFKGEASPAYLFVPALPVVALCLLDPWYPKRERLFRHLFDDVRRKNGPADFSMDVAPFKNSVPSLLTAAASPTRAL